MIRPLRQLDAGGKPSTWSPPGKLSELSRINWKKKLIKKIILYCYNKSKRIYSNIIQSKLETTNYKYISEHAIVLRKTPEDSGDDWRLSLRDFFEKWFSHGEYKEKHAKIAANWESWICPTGATSNSVNAKLLSGLQGSMQKYAASKRMALPTWTWLDAGGKPSTWSPPGKLSELSRIY